MDTAALQHELDAGCVFEAHHESVGDRGPECTTIVVRRLPDGGYRLHVDRYLLEPPYGVDLSEWGDTFETVADLAERMRTVGFEVWELGLSEPASNTGVEE